jgi:translocation and assembly module TamB
MRALKITVLVSLLTTVVAVIVLTVSLAWLARSEQGSRWLLERGFELAPLTIEADGISGTLAEGLGVETLFIALPVVELRFTEIVVSWSPANLLAGIVDINSARIAELDIAILESETKGEPIDDLLFWLQIPLDIAIESGQLDKLRIEEAEFDNIRVSGRIGHGRLAIEKLGAQIAGVDLQAKGELAGPAPGRLVADASWALPEQNLDGGGSFEGDIEQLGFSQVIHVPDRINFNGTIHDLFKSPTLTGVADWKSVRLPVETALQSNAGRFEVSSDFRSAQLEGDSVVLFEDWPEAPLQLEALLDLKGVTIESYTINTMDGTVFGSGRIDYQEGLQGELAIKGDGIDTGLLLTELPGRLGFDAALIIESAEAYTIDVSRADARIAERDLAGTGRVRFQSGKPAALETDIHAGTNRLIADVQLVEQLAGRIDVKALDLAMLWPGLAGVANASATLSGSVELPSANVTASASSVSYGALSFETLALSGQLQQGNRLAGKLETTGLVAGEQRLGNLVYDLKGTLAEHQSSLVLSQGVVDINLRASGGWDGQTLSQRFNHGRIQPDGFDSWQLAQNPELRLSVTGGRLGAHCWTEHDASICMAESSWDADSLKSQLVVDGFALATLQPLLAEGYRLDGSIDADVRVTRDAAGFKGELHWRQSQTTLGYADDIDSFQTVIDSVHIDLISDPTETRLTAALSGEQELNLKARAVVDGPLEEASPLQASAEGRMPNIGLLRPLLQRVANPGELEGELTMDLKAGGTLGDPLFTGGADLANGVLGLPTAGVTLTGIYVTAQSRGTDELTVTGELASGDGRAEIQGEIRAVEGTNLVADIRIQGQNLASVRTPDLSVDTSPDLKLFIGEGVFDITGRLVIPHALAQIRTLPQNAVPRSADVVVHAPEREIAQQQETLVTGDVEVVLGDDVQFLGFGLTSRLEGGLRLRQSRGGNLRTSGTVRVRDGFLTGYGRELRVDRGELTFTGPLDDPLVNIEVSRESIYEGRQYTIGLRLTGSAQNIRTEPFSRPALSEQDVITFLLLDRPASSDADASGAALALGLQQLLPDQSGRFGLDEVSFETNDAGQAAMVAGKRINEDLTVRYVFGSVGTPGSFRIRYRLGRGFSLEASTGNRQSMDLIYLLER